MKSFGFFAILNVLALLAYAQDQTIPSITCEQSFALQGTTCSPCQQAVFKYDKSTESFLAKQPPSDKCLVTSILVYHLTENNPAATPATPGAPPTLDPKKVTEAIDKTCAETNNGCNESDAKNAYTEIAKACDAELNQLSTSGKQVPTTPAGLVGVRAQSTIFQYYLAIPTRETLCFKSNGEYCAAKYFEQASKAQTQSQQSPVMNPFSNLQCDECSKHTYNVFKSYISSHPLDTPSLQKLLDQSNTGIQEIEKKCPDFATSGPSGSSGPGAKSDGQKLSNNYLGTILMGLIGFIFM